MARLQRVKTTLDQAEARGAIAGAAAKAARELLSLPHVNALVVVVNRVDTARETWRSLQAMSWAEAPLARGPETVLLTGRMRPLERDALVGELTGRVSAGRSRGDDVAPLVVVATQCIEAGADYDFDALVTECASLDALRQRFGRLDRLGELSAAGTPAQGVVLGPSSTVAKGADDPVYGAAIPPTWAFLHDSETEGVVDFGCSAPAGHEPPPEGTLSRLKVAPHLLPREVECWVETPLPPLASALGAPDVARFLHGDDRETADVQVVWRADLSEELLADKDGDDALSTARAIVAFCPPRDLEAMPVPISALRAWLAQRPQVEVSDVEGAKTDQDDGGGALRPFLVWDADSSRVGTSSVDLRPGATIVVPSTYGGVHRARFGEVDYGWWDPAATAAVTDLGEKAQEKTSLRWCMRLIPPLLGEGVRPPVPSQRDDDVSVEQAVKDWADAHEGSPLSSRNGWRAKVFELEPRWLPSAPGPGALPASWYAVSGRAPVRGRSGQGTPVHAAGDTRETDEAGSEPDTSPFTGAEVPLKEHLEGAGAAAYRFATNCGLPQGLAADLMLAGRLHDIGKADPRFQAWLRDGYPAPPGAEPLAKSVLPASDPRRRASTPAGTVPQGRPPRDPERRHAAGCHGSDGPGQGLGPRTALGRFPPRLGAPVRARSG